MRRVCGGLRFVGGHRSGLQEAGRRVRGKCGRAAERPREVRAAAPTGAMRSRLGEISGARRLRGVAEGGQPVLRTLRLSRGLALAVTYAVVRSTRSHGMSGADIGPRRFP